MFQTKQLFILFISIVTFVSQQCKCHIKNEETTRHKVIIVGAGAAGIAALTKLLRNNITDVIVLEAKDRIGGRVHTTIFANNIIEEGAQYVHGEKDNAVFELIKDLNVYVHNTHEANSSFEISAPTKETFDNSLASDLFALRHKVLDNDELKKTDQNYRDYLYSEFNSSLFEYGLNEESFEVLMNVIEKVEGVHNAVRVQDQNTLGLAQYLDCEGDQSITWSRGYSTLFDILLGKFPEGSNYTGGSEKILLNKEVNHIDWGVKGVNVSCADGSNYEADRVILTLPLGVLKNITNDFFNPTLPIMKRRAIQELGFGTVDKIFLEFHDKWWSDEFSGYLFGMSTDMREEYKLESQFGLWPTDITGFSTLSDAPNLLLGWIYGESAKQMEAATDEAVLEACKDILDRVFSNSTFDVPCPVTVFRSKWYKDSFARGSYSYRVTNTSSADLEEPLFNYKNEPVVMFAGEASHNHYFSTVHGAIETGWREANRIINLNKN